MTCWRMDDDRLSNLEFHSSELVLTLEKETSGEVKFEDEVGHS